MLRESCQLSLQRTGGDHEDACISGWAPYSRIWDLIISHCLKQWIWPRTGGMWRMWSTYGAMQSWVACQKQRRRFSNIVKCARDERYRMNTRGSRRCSCWHNSCNCRSSNQRGILATQHQRAPWGLRDWMNRPAPFPNRCCKRRLNQALSVHSVSVGSLSVFCWLLGSLFVLR